MESFRICSRIKRSTLSIRKSVHFRFCFFHLKSMMQRFIKTIIHSWSTPDNFLLHLKKAENKNEPRTSNSLLKTIRWESFSLKGKCSFSFSELCEKHPVDKMTHIAFIQCKRALIVDGVSQQKNERENNAHHQWKWLVALRWLDQWWTTNERESEMN